MVRRRPVFSTVLGTVLGILILASGCADRNPTTTQLDPATALSASKAYLSGEYAVTLSPSGGTINFPIGKIIFPAGAVPRTTKIRAKLDGRTIAVHFQPHLEFPVGAQPILTLSYAGTGAVSRKLVVHHVNDDGELVNVLSPVINDTDESLEIRVNSFSGFVLGSSF